VTFPERLITLRLESGLSQHQLADELKTNQSKIKRFELGLQEPKLSELQQISKIFEISISELLQNVEARIVKKGGTNA
jgi:transcriptional regulator with XRE-family HTH domain